MELEISKWLQDIELSIDEIYEFIKDKKDFEVIGSFKKIKFDESGIIF